MTILWSSALVVVHKCLLSCRGLQFSSLLGESVYTNPITIQMHVHTDLALYKRQMGEIKKIDAPDLALR